MTATEQIIDALATYGPGLAALAVAGRQWLTSRARINSAIAATTELALERERKLADRLERVELQLTECEQARESLEAGTAELRRIIEEMREQLRGWQRSLARAGIPADDSDERDAALSALTEAAEAHHAEKARIRRIREVAGHRGGGTDG